MGLRGGGGSVVCVWVKGRQREEVEREGDVPRRIPCARSASEDRSTADAGGVFWVLVCGC